MATRNGRTYADAVALHARVWNRVRHEFRWYNVVARRLRRTGRSLAHPGIVGYSRRAETTTETLPRLRQLRVLCMAHRFAGLSFSDERRAGVPHTALLCRHLVGCHACSYGGIHDSRVCHFMILKLTSERQRCRASALRS